MGKTNSEINQDKINIAVLTQKVDAVATTVGKIETKLDLNYATKEWVEAEYGQTRKIVNAILISFALALIGAFATFIVRGGLIK